VLDDHAGPFNHTCECLKVARNIQRAIATSENFFEPFRKSGALKPARPEHPKFPQVRWLGPCDGGAL